MEERLKLSGLASTMKSIQRLHAQTYDPPSGNPHSSKTERYIHLPRKHQGIENRN